MPFVLNGYVAGPVASGIPFTTPGWNIDQYFRRVELVKPTPFGAAPDVTDGVVYTDEHVDSGESAGDGITLAWTPP